MLHELWLEYLARGAQQQAQRERAVREKLVACMRVHGDQYSMRPARLKSCCSAVLLARKAVALGGAGEKRRASSWRGTGYAAFVAEARPVSAA
jgi:hypothetical protein